MKDLPNRIRTLLGDDPNVSEKKMFGGICFMLNGNMLCSASGTGDLMLRIGKEREEEALALPHTRKMDFTGRPMRGYIYATPQGWETDEQLAEWIALATEFVGTLPPK